MSRTEFEHDVAAARRLRQTGDFRSAAAALQHAAERFRSRRMTFALPWLQVQLAVIARHAGSYETASALLERAQAQATATSADEMIDRWIEAQRLELRRIRGESVGVTEFQHLGAEISHAGDLAGGAWCMNAAAQSLLNRGQASEAYEQFGESLDAAMSAGDRAEAGWAARGAAEALRRLDRGEDGAPFLSHAARSFGELGYANGSGYVVRSRAQLLVSDGRAQEALTVCRATCRWIGLEDRTRAYLLVTAAQAAEADAQHKLARELRGTAMKLFARIGVSPPEVQLGDAFRESGN